MNWDLITVTFNSSDVLLANWDWYTEWSDRINWIVVDNNSKDNTVQVAERLGAKVIQNTENLGFSSGCNLGFSNSYSQYVLFANPDLRVQPEDLPALEATLKNEKCLLTPQLLNSDGSLQINGRGKPYLSAKMAHRGAKIFSKRLPSYLPIPADNRLSQVTWIMGACIATRRETFIELGLWDERYFIYYEDHEIGMRANQLGIQVIINSALQWKHEWARATKTFNTFAWYHEFRSASIFYRTYPELLR
jgi:N-acetylglucosaminyl-diphospho-decaprenol L-rhamnosyltransferase